MAEADVDDDDLISGAQHYITCDECESRPAVYYCQTCPGDLCEECGEKHKTAKLFKNHTVISIVQSRLWHKDQPSSRDDNKKIAPATTLSTTLFTNAKEQWGLTRLTTTRVFVGSSDRYIRDLDISGKQNPNIELNISENDGSYGFTVMNDKNILFLDRNKKRIYKYAADKSYCLFAETKWEPHCLCTAKSGDVIVGQGTSDKKGFLRRIFTKDKFFEIGKVVVYSESGEKKREIMKSKGKDLYHYPFGVAENRVNRDIIVSDAEEKVVVVNELGRLRFIYRGVQSHSNFTPYQLDTDCLGNILICDDDKAHIISKDGDFISYLVTESHGIERPMGISFDGRDSVWIAEFDTKKVKVFKYLE